MFAILKILDLFTHSCPYLKSIFPSMSKFLFNHMRSYSLIVLSNSCLTRDWWFPTAFWFVSALPFSSDNLGWPVMLVVVFCFRGLLLKIWDTAWDETGLRGDHYIQWYTLWKVHVIELWGKHVRHLGTSTLFSLHMPVKPPACDGPHPWFLKD